MKTSIDLPDDLYRQVKSKSALQGRAVREVATELFSAWVRSDEHPKQVSRAGGSDAVERAATPTDDDVRSTWLRTWGELAAGVADATGGDGGLVDQLRTDRR